MHIIELIQEAGAVGYLAIALGGLGVTLGFFAIIALLAKSPSAFTMGVATLLVGAAAAGAGIGGTFHGRSQVDAAVVFVGDDSGLDKDRILRQGYKEAQSCSWLGFFAALVPLALGGAAALGGARIRRPQTQAQRLGNPMVSTDEGAGQTIVAGVFVAITLLALGGAWMVAHSALPKLKYDFADDDSDAWGLASVLERAKTNRSARTCESLASELMNFWAPGDRREWPRQLRRPIPPVLAAWREEANRCITHALEQLEAGDTSEGWTQASILDSPLLQDDALHARALAFAPKEPAADSDGPRIGQGGLAKEAIAGALRGAKGAIRFCYERELQKAPNLEGKITVKFVIGPEGKVKSASDDSDAPFPSAKVTDCVLGVVRKLKFPPTSGGGEVIVRYPFIFKAS